MRNAIAALQRKLTPDRTADVAVEERPTTDLYECPACRSMIIQPSSERCSQCNAATLVRR